MDLEFVSLEEIILVFIHVYTDITDDEILNLEKGLRCNNRQDLTLCIYNTPMIKKNPTLMAALVKFNNKYFKWNGLEYLISAKLHEFKFDLL